MPDLFLRGALPEALPSPSSGANMLQQHEPKKSDCAQRKLHFALSTSAPMARKHTNTNTNTQTDIAGKEEAQHNATQNRAKETAAYRAARSETRQVLATMERHCPCMFCLRTCCWRCVQSFAEQSMSTSVPLKQSHCNSWSRRDGTGSQQPSKASLATCMRHWLRDRGKRSTQTARHTNTQTQKHKDAQGTQTQTKPTTTLQHTSFATTSCGLRPAP